MESLGCSGGICPRMKDLTERMYERKIFVISIDCYTLKIIEIIRKITEMVTK